MIDSVLAARLDRLAEKLMEGTSTPSEDNEFERLYTIFKHVTPIGR